MSAKLGIYAPDDQEVSTPHRRTNAICSQMTLTQFFDKWFYPIVLKAERNCRQSTILIYRDALEWWKRLTGNPPLIQIDEYVVAEFQTKLRDATYRRKLADGKEYPLSRQTQRKHLRHVRAVLYRTGPTLDDNRPAKGLVAVAPTIRLPDVPTPRKACFTWAQCQMIVAATRRIKAPANVHGVSPIDWWRCWIGLHFYSGQRNGTLRRLTWENVQPDDDGQLWLDIPAEFVDKTQKEVRVVVHPKLLEALLATRRTNHPKEPLIPYAFEKSWVDEWHLRLQSLAGIPNENRLYPHAWRRTHVDQLGQLGLQTVAEACRTALDHSDLRTTTSHYVDIVNKFRLELPPLW